MDSRILEKWEQKSGKGMTTKMPDEGYHVNI